MADYVRAYGGISLLGGLSALTVYIKRANGFSSLIEMDKGVATRESRRCGRLQQVACLAIITNDGNMFEGLT